MYSINGIPLHDALRGWRVLRAGTNTQGGITKTVGKVPSPGRPGYTPSPNTFTEQMIIFNMRVTRASLESLLMLCDAATTLTRTDDPTKFAAVELSSAIPSSDAPLDAMFDVTITLIAYQGLWRDVTFPAGAAGADGVSPIAITTPVQSIIVMNDLSGPIFDGSLFLRGVFGQFTLTDSGGSSLKTTRVWPGTASNGLLFFGSTNQAFFANETDPFTPLTDASQYIDVSGNGGFRMTPKMVSGNPAVRRVELSLTTLTQTSTTLRLKAKRAYRMN